MGKKSVHTNLLGVASFVGNIDVKWEQFETN